MGNLAPTTPRIALTISSRKRRRRAGSPPHSSLRRLVRGERNWETRYPWAAWSWTPSKPADWITPAVRAKRPMISTTSGAVRARGGRKILPGITIGTAEGATGSGLRKRGDCRPGWLSWVQIAAPPAFARVAQVRSASRWRSSSTTTLRGSPSARRSTMMLPVINRPAPPRPQRSYSRKRRSSGAWPTPAMSSLIADLAIRLRRIAPQGRVSGASRGGMRGGVIRRPEEVHGRCTAADPRARRTSRAARRSLCTVPTGGMRRSGEAAGPAAFHLERCG